MKVLVDGVEVKCLNDVRIVVELEDEGDGAFDTLHLVLTHEGVITDLTENGVVVATKSEEYHNIVEELDTNSDYFI